MITANVIQRVFHIKIGCNAGTAFAIEHEEKQYLVTARHVVERQQGEVEVAIFYSGEWKRMTMNIVGTTEGEIDIAVLVPPTQLAPTFPLEPSTRNMTLGQQAFFLGFPLGMTGGFGEMNRDFPLPLVKAGIVSTLPSRPQRIFWIDGHNNPGFSGGPLVFVPNGQAVSKNTPYKVAGVISAYRTSQASVYDAQGNKIGVTRENTGIVLVHDISHAIDLIKANPIGCEVSV